MKQLSSVTSGRNAAWPGPARPDPVPQRALHQQSNRIQLLLYHCSSSTDSCAPQKPMCTTMQSVGQHGASSRNAAYSYIRQPILARRKACAMAMAGAVHFNRHCPHSDVALTAGDTAARTCSPDSALSFELTFLCMPASTRCLVQRVFLSGVCRPQIPMRPPPPNATMGTKTVSGAERGFTAQETRST